MRFLGVGQHNDLGALYLELAKAGHQVRVRVDDPASHDVLSGMIARSDASFEQDLDWLGCGPEGGLILFEGTGHGALQSQLRAQGYRVIGGSAFGDRLENDRAFGQSTLAGLGLPTAATHEFAGFDQAIRFVEQTRRRYVLKFSGSGFASTRSYVAMLPDGSDMLAMLIQQRQKWAYEETPTVVLMDHLQGVEVGVGAWFNGRAFLEPANIDWEHKRFFPGDIGELTGEMGTVVSYEYGHRLFESTLARLAPQLRQAGHVGYVNLNMIVNEQGPFPLELTCRFGYPGFAILGALHKQPWDEVLRRIATGASSLEVWPGFALGVVLTVPPFPYPDGYERLSKGMPICFQPDLSDADRDSLHFAEVGLKAGQLVTAGEVGYIMVVTGRGDSVAEARNAAQRIVQKVAIPNMRYRTDIGVRLETHDQAELRRLGWLP
jgi:phosphoribosylamine--glycine ligase